MELNLNLTVLQKPKSVGFFYFNFFKRNIETKNVCPIAYNYSLTDINVLQFLKNTNKTNTMKIFKQPTTEHLQKERVNVLFSLLKSEFDCGLFHKQLPNTEHEQVQMCNALIEKLRNNLRTEFSNAINRQKEEQENAERINLALENLK